MAEFIISSECPKCGQARIQAEQTAEELIPLLRTGGAIAAYCSSCDAEWELSTAERADIARTLTK